MDQLQKFVLDPIKPVLLPITTNLPAPINNGLIGLLGEPCHSALLLDADVSSHPECVSLAISKALGIGIITAASVVKVPQIIKLARSQSAQGLSLPSYVLETVSFLITLAYNVRSGFPFSTYGEVSLILVQDVVICVLISLYSGRLPIAGAFLAVIGASAYAMMGSDTMVTGAQMTQFQTMGGVLAVASKLPQILSNYQTGGTGQLSAFAVFNYLAGSLSRIFTTLQEVDDKLILYGFIAGFILNAVLAAQMVYYWNSTTSSKHGKELDPNLRIDSQGVLQKEKAGTALEGTPGSPRPTSSSGRRKA